MSWLTRGKPTKLALLAAAIGVAWLISGRRRREVWHTLDQGSATGP
jgi:hypothetical protein